MPAAIPIHRVDDERVDPFRDLRAGRRLRREGLFVAEGEWLVQRVLSSGLKIASILCSARRYDRVLASAPSDCPVYTMSEDQMSQLVGFRFHRGVLACAHRPPSADSIDCRRLRDASRLTIVACPTVADPVNLGRIARISAGLGVDALLLSDKCADEFSRRALRVSMGSVLTMPLVRTDDLVQQLQRLRSELGCTLVASTLDPRAIDLPDYCRPARIVLLMGAEDFGLPPSLVKQCDEMVTLRMPPHADSLNVADATAIFLYELNYAHLRKRTLAPDFGEIN